MNQFLRILIVGGIFFTFAGLAEGQTASKLPKPHLSTDPQVGGHGLVAPSQGADANGGTKPGSAVTPTIAAVDSGPMSFTNEEANFYRRAWPIDKSHSLGALILFGSILVTLLTLIIRQMAKSGPRKPIK